MFDQNEARMTKEYTFDYLLSQLRAEYMDASVLKQYNKQFASYMPQIVVMFDYDQQNPAHPYDLWMHSLYTVMYIPRDLPDDMLYFAALLHDIGKPDCRQGRPGSNHMRYPGHPHRSMEIVRDTVIPTLEQRGVVLTQDQKKKLLYYVAHHDDLILSKNEYIKTQLEVVSPNTLSNTMLLQIADALAHFDSPPNQLRIRTCQQVLEILKEY